MVETLNRQRFAFEFFCWNDTFLECELRGPSAFERILTR